MFYNIISFMYKKKLLHISATTRSAASHAIELFVSRRLAGQQTRILRILEVISERCAPILIPVIPALTGAIRTIETKRGVGIDKQLR